MIMWYLQYHLHMGDALPLSHDGLLSRERASSHAGDRRTFHPGTAEPFRVSRHRWRLTGAVNHNQ